MPATRSDLEHDPDAWRGDTVQAMRFHTPDLTSPNRQTGDWGSTLILDIDHVVDRAVPDARTPFVTAALIFHDVHDLSVSINWGDAHSFDGLREPTIARVLRDPAADGFHWRIILCRPLGGLISFRASGLAPETRQTAVPCEVPASSG